MRKLVMVVAFSVSFLIAASVSGQQSVQDKVYNLAQAKQGLATYDKQCATCHDGGTMGPELWGDAFLNSWKSQKVAALFKRIKETMPEDKPGSLSEAEVLSVIAFVLQQNGFPAGEKPIESAASLETMTFQ